MQRSVAPAPAHALTGRVFKETYRIVALLGVGGMAEVFRAEQLSVAGRHVAVKILELRGLDPGERSVASGRFRREAEAMSALRHPNTVQVLDFGETGDGLMWLAMELVEGETLSARLRRLGALPPRELARHGVGVCRALVEAHALGVIHRDLKPSNVHLARMPSGQEVVKVGDFGIAKLTRAATATMTREGDSIGTPRYMAPEQVAGEEAVPATDLYAFGVMLHELLTGAPPFEAPDSLAVMYAQLHQAPPELQLSGLSEAELAGWRALVGRLLAKEPAKRPGSAADVAAALEALAEGRAVQVAFDAEPSPAQTAPVWPGGGDGATVARTPLLARQSAPRRRAAWALAGTTLALAAVIAVVVASGDSGPKPEARAVEVEPRAVGARPEASVASVASVASAARDASGEDFAAADSAPETAVSADVAPADVDPFAERASAHDLVVVPAGDYRLGCREAEVGCWADARLQAPVRLPAFAIGRREVSVGAYRECVAAEGCVEPARGRGCSYFVKGGAELPVACVSWAEAEAYCAWRGLRLPTELEWEAAARGQDGRRYPWGADRPTCERTVLRDRRDSRCAGRPQTVGSRAQDVSPAGAHDMGGNVREWTASLARAYPGADVAPGDDALARVTRGSSAVETAARYGALFRRMADAEGERLPNLGFRCAWSPEGGP